VAVLTRSGEDRTVILAALAETGLTALGSRERPLRKAR
jgi:hypothetical protein